MPPSFSPPRRPVTRAVAAWRERYYAFRHARDRVLAGRLPDAVEILAGPHGDYVRERFESLASDARFADALVLARATLPPINQADASPRPTRPNPRTNPAEQARRDLAQLESAIMADPPAGWMDVSPDLAAAMVASCNILTGDRVLVPCAGLGRVVDAILTEHPSAIVDAWEAAIPLREALVVKRQLVPFDLAGSDFLDESRLATRRSYHNVLIAPPLGSGQDVRHVLHAWRYYLRPGGRIVSIVDDASLHRRDRAARELQAIAIAHATPREGTNIFGGVGGVPARILKLCMPA